MAAKTEDLQRMLDDAWDTAPAEGNTLRNELRKYESAAGALIAQGSLSSVSKNSANQTYALYGIGTLTTAEIARAWRDLINLYDGCLTILTNAGTTITDENLYAEMKARLVPVYQTRPDISGMNLVAR